jgi:hypothetical protein
MNELRGLSLRARTAGNRRRTRPGPHRLVGSEWANRPQGTVGGQGPNHDPKGNRERAVDHGP